MSSERVKPYEEKMKKTIEHLTKDLQGVRAGRANPHVLDKIKVDYYGSPTPIQSVANISVPEARIIQIAPWEKKMIKEISRATVIRLVFPELTGERRKQLSKDVKKMGEEAKVAIRNIRRDGVDTFKKLKKTEDVSEDVVKELQDEITKLTDKHGKEIDKIIEEKTKEIMTFHK